MPLVAQVGRKSRRVRGLLGVVYAALIMGALTTVLPFALMAGQSMNGSADERGWHLVPPYLTSPAELTAKWREDKFAKNLPLMAAYDTGAEAKTEGWSEFLMSLEPDQFIAGFDLAPGEVNSPLAERWRAWLQAQGTLEEINARFGEINATWLAVGTVKENLLDPAWRGRPGPKAEEWRRFKAQLPAEFRIPVTGRALTQSWLRLETSGRIDEAPADIRRGADEIEAVDLPPPGPARERLRAEALPASHGGQFIEERWGGELPLAAFESQHLSQNAGAVRAEMAGRAWRYAWAALASDGRSLMNTFIFCGLAILTQLTVNPLAAYALSRFPLAVVPRILLFLLATMAFPAEVTMIPGFLLLKDLSLLNTFWALVLPAAANGFMIFLLKSFFDSLPREVFESGQIDGAPEWVMMMRLALPMAKPVLGYLALLAFMGAYGSFMHALLVTQKREMWTLMVNIYQLQSFAPRPVMMAAVTLAALPTLVVFLAAQRVIMRGIILPDDR
jgi:ABC-type glycerol-3-phosphate transport system permease component